MTIERLNFEEYNTLHGCKVVFHDAKPVVNYHHTVRHVKRCVDNVLDIAERFFSCNKIDIKIHEWLFNNEFENIWICHTHASHKKHVDACHKWISWLHENTFKILNELHFTLYDILHHLFPPHNWNDNDVALKSCLEDLSNYIDSFSELVEIVNLVKQVSDSEYVKRHKNYLLRQIWKRARSNRLVTLSLKRGYGPDQTCVRAALDLFGMLERTKNSVYLWLNMKRGKDIEPPFENINFIVKWSDFIRTISGEEKNGNGETDG